MRPTNKKDTHSEFSNVQYANIDLNQIDYQVQQVATQNVHTLSSAVSTSKVSTQFYVSDKIKNYSDYFRLCLTYSEKSATLSVLYIFCFYTFYLMSSYLNKRIETYIVNYDLTF